MRLFFKFIICTVFLFSACENMNEIDKEISSPIEGDWIVEYELNNGKACYAYFSFIGNSFSSEHGIGMDAKFDLVNDTITIYAGSNVMGPQVYKDEKITKYSILNLSESTLTLTLIQEEGDVRFEPLNAAYCTSRTLDTIKLRKLIPKPHIKFERLGFYSTVCFGTCPAMYLEIDSLGNFYFHGDKFTSKIGLFKGKLDNNQLKRLNDLVSQIEYTMDTTSHSINWVVYDAPEIKSLLKLEDKLILSGTSKFSENSIGLRILNHSLINMYEKVDLEIDSSIGDDLNLLHQYNQLSKERKLKVAK